MAQTREKPKFVVRAPDPNNRGRWLTLGAAWEKTLDDGQTAYSVKLNTLPVGAGWDGALMLLPPLPKSDEGEPSQ
jgi:uncharacterized protein (DUF736 family)